MRKFKSTIVVFLFLVLQVSLLNAHCEIPCGIYDDQARVKLLLEHAKTIEKSMVQMISMEKSGNANSNQYVRWVSNKEEHANEVQHIVSQYFMTQRIKPDTNDYELKLSILHKMLLAAMKCKQTTDTENVKELTSLVKEFEKLYFD